MFPKASGCVSHTPFGKEAIEYMCTKRAWKAWNSEVDWLGESIPFIINFSAGGIGRSLVAVNLEAPVSARVDIGCKPAPTSSHPLCSACDCVLQCLCKVFVLTLT